MNLHNPFLSRENGDEFMERFHRAAEGGLSPFILVIEGSIPDEENKPEGCWASLGTDKATGQPILTCDRIDWLLAPRAWAVVASGTCAAYGGIHAMEGNPTGCMDLMDYLGRNWKSNAGIPIVNVPGRPVAVPCSSACRSSVSGDEQCGALEPGKSAVLMRLSAWFRTAPKR